MKDIKEIFINKLTNNMEICPSEIDLVEICQQDCTNCWRHALRNIDITEREESK